MDEHQDHAIEAEALFTLLESPHQLTIDELCLELGVSLGFAARESVEVALRELARVGLVHRRGTLAWPSRAALAFHELTCD